MDRNKVNRHTTFICTRRGTGQTGRLAVMSMVDRQSNKWTRNSWNKQYATKNKKIKTLPKSLPISHIARMTFFCGHSTKYTKQKHNAQPMSVRASVRLLKNFHHEDQLTKLYNICYWRIIMNNLKIYTMNIFAGIEKNTNTSVTIGRRHWKLSWASGMNLSSNRYF